VQAHRKENVNRQNIKEPVLQQGRRQQKVEAKEQKVEVKEQKTIKPQKQPSP
jgi:hypothetical protein